MVLTTLWKAARPRTISRKCRIQDRRCLGANRGRRSETFELDNPVRSPRPAQRTREIAREQYYCHRNQNQPQRNQLVRPYRPRRQCNEVVSGSDHRRKSYGKTQLVSNISVPPRHTNQRGFSETGGRSHGPPRTNVVGKSRDSKLVSCQMPVETSAVGLARPLFSHNPPDQSSHPRDLCSELSAKSLWQDSC